MTKREKRIIGTGIGAVAVTLCICVWLIGATYAEDTKGKTAVQSIVQTVAAAVPETEALIVIETNASITAETEMAESTPAVETAAEELLIEQNMNLYTYEDMEKDIAVLSRRYSEAVQTDSLGETADGRQIHHILIGDADAPKHMLITASIHAREYITTQLVMKQTAVFLEELSKGTRALENIAIHVVPMINPDGVTISQFGWDGIQKEETRQYINQIMAWDGSDGSGSYFRRWKANARGVDLNRNFDALWSQYAGSGHPSSDHYKGEAPGSEAEAEALISLTKQYPFVRTISYHTQGEVIYWYFGQTGELKDITEQFGKAVSKTTGYPMDANYEKLDPAGYKDWAIMQLGIPSLTIEVGRETSPVPPGQFSEIWERNQDVWNVMLQNAA